MTTQELMQAVLALTKEERETVRDAIVESLDGPVEASPELLGLLQKRSADFASGAPGVPFDEAMARLRRT